MSTVPRVECYVDADADVIHIASRGCDVPMTFGEARAVRDELTALLALHDPTERDHELHEWREDRWRWFAPGSEAVTP